MWWYSFVIAFLFAITFLLYTKRNRKLDVYTLILGVYTLVSLCCVLFAYSDPHHYDNLHIINFIYLYIVVMIFIQPFKFKDFSCDNIHIENTFFIKLLITIYFISGIVSVVYTLPRAMSLAAMGDWSAVRADVYNDMNGIELYTNQFERLCKNLYTYLAPFGVVWVFYQFTKPKFNAILTFSMLIIWAISEYCSATLIASRGMILTFGIKLLTLYIFFRNGIPVNRKKYIYIGAGIALAFFLSYTLSVTDSRFGDDANDSLFMYFGHSMLAFNDGIMGSMHDYAWGRYFFKWLYDMLGLDSSINFTQLGSTHGSAFMTFVGCFYVDFGPIGTLLLGILFSRWLSTYTNKQTYSLSTFIVIVYFATWFIDGVFVFGRSQSLTWLMLLVLSFILKRTEKVQ